MSQQSAGGAPQLGQRDGEEQGRSVESQRLVSEDYSHYILIKGGGGHAGVFTGSEEGFCVFTAKG